MLYVLILMKYLFFLLYDESQAQQHQPFIPNELISYIADSYVCNRQLDLKTAEKNGEYTSMTARQLLSTLRLAQAHAKVHFRDVVTTDDIEEALRLIYMSKASIIDTEDSKNKRDDVLSSVYAIIREYFIANEITYVKLDKLEPYVTRKGYSSMQLQV